MKRLSKYFSDVDLKELLSLFDKYGKLVEVHIEITGCRDLKDNFLLSLAVESKADYLVSGDSDLLILKKIKKTRIVTLSDFMKEIK